MRKLLFALLLTLAASTALADPPDEDVHRPHVPGRGGWYLQFDLGLNVTFLDGNTVARFPEPLDGPASLFESGTGLGPLLGATVGYQFSPRFALALRGEYDARDASNAATVQDTCPTYDLLGNRIGFTMMDVNKDFSVTADYFSLSLLGNVRFDRLYIFFGPTVSVPVGFQTSETDQILDTTAGCPYFEGSGAETNRIAGTFSNAAAADTRVSFKLGAGYLIPLSPKISLVPQLAYDLGLTDLLTTDVTNTLASPSGLESLPVLVNGKMRLSSLQATIGLRVNL
jgi:hypothetical protein